MTEQESNSKPKNALPWIAGVLLVLGLAVIGGFYWNRTGKVEDVQFKGYHYVSEQQLQHQVDIPIGVHPDSLNIVGIMKKYEEIPYVKTARISTSPGGQLTVDLTERQPIAMLVDGSRRAYVDADGVRLPQVLGKTPDVPLLYGFNTQPVGDTLSSDAFKAAGKFLAELHQRKVSDATISEVAWNDKEGVVALSNENGVKLIFGKGDFDKRLRNWEAFYREVVGKKGINKMHSVDLRFEGQIVTNEDE